MNASQSLFKASGLTQWGRLPDFIAPKPMSSRQIRKLGEALDRAEAERFKNGETRHTFYVLALEYGQALAARNLYRRCKAENAERVPTHRDAIKLKGRIYGALAHLEELEELDSDLVTKRDFLEANSAYALAIALFDIAEQKYQTQEATARRRDAADRASNIVRRTYRRKSEVHL